MSPSDSVSQLPKLTAIVAMTPERIIGKDGTLPWHLPEDLAFFKRTTSGHPIVMGRTTYESIGRPLPKRRNIVLTRNPEWTAEGVDVILSPEELSELDLESETFIIGGSQIYEIFLPQLDEILVSHVHHCHSGDTTFPSFEADFSEPEILESHDDFEVRRYRSNN